MRRRRARAACASRARRSAARSSGAPSPLPSASAPAAAPGRAERAGLGLDQQHDRQPVDPDRQPREQRRREQARDVRRAEDLQVLAHCRHEPPIRARLISNRSQIRKRPAAGRTPDISERLRERRAAARGRAPRDSRVRCSSARRSHDHPRVDQVIERVRADGVTISTQAAYDVCEALHRAGLARRIEPAGGPARYESRVGDNHHHLVCRALRARGRRGLRGRRGALPGARRPARLPPRRGGGHVLGPVPRLPARTRPREEQRMSEGNGKQPEQGDEGPDQPPGPSGLRQPEPAHGRRARPGDARELPVPREDQPLRPRARARSASSTPAARPRSATSRRPARSATSRSPSTPARSCSRRPASAPRSPCASRPSPAAATPPRRSATRAASR